DGGRPSAPPARRPPRLHQASRLRRGLALYAEISRHHSTRPWLLPLLKLSCLPCVDLSPDFPSLESAAPAIVPPSELNTCCAIGRRPVYLPSRGGGPIRPESIPPQPAGPDRQAASGQDRQELGDDARGGGRLSGGCGASQQRPAQTPA